MDTIRPTTIDLAHLRQARLAAPLDRRGAAQLVDGELERALDDFAAETIALDGRQHGGVRAVHRRFERVDADGAPAPGGDRRTDD